MTQLIHQFTFKKVGQNSTCRSNIKWTYNWPSSPETSCRPNLTAAGHTSKEEGKINLALLNASISICKMDVSHHISQPVLYLSYKRLFKSMYSKNWPRKKSIPGTLTPWAVRPSCAWTPDTLVSKLVRKRCQSPLCSSSARKASTIIFHTQQSWESLPKPQRVWPRGISVLQSSTVYWVCCPTFSLAAFFLLVYLEENRLWILHPLLQPTRGSCWGGWRTWVARGVSTSSIMGWEPPWWDAVDHVSLPSSLPGFSARGSWPQLWLFFI